MNPETEALPIKSQLEGPTANWTYQYKFIARDDKPFFDELISKRVECTFTTHHDDFDGPHTCNGLILWASEDWIALQTTSGLAHRQTKAKVGEHVDGIVLFNRRQIIQIDLGTYKPRTIEQKK